MPSAKAQDKNQCNQRDTQGWKVRFLLFYAMVDRGPSVAFMEWKCGVTLSHLVN